MLFIILGCPTVYSRGEQPLGSGRIAPAGCMWMGFGAGKGTRPGADSSHGWARRHQDNPRVVHRSLKTASSTGSIPSADPVLDTGGASTIASLMNPGCNSTSGGPQGCWPGSLSHEAIEVNLLFVHTASESGITPSLQTPQQIQGTHSRRLCHPRRLRLSLVVAVEGYEWLQWNSTSSWQL